MKISFIKCKILISEKALQKFIFLLKSILYDSQTYQVSAFRRLDLKNFSHIKQKKTNKQKGMKIKQQTQQEDPLLTRITACGVFFCILHKNAVRNALEKYLFVNFVHARKIFFYIFINNNLSHFYIHHRNYILVYGIHFCISKIVFIQYTKLFFAGYI